VATTDNELISSASNVVIADLTLREAYDHPIHVSGNPAPITGTLLHNLRLVDPGQQAIKINPVGQGAPTAARSVQRDRAHRCRATFRP
jgi:hypothetical protein